MMPSHFPTHSLSPFPLLTLQCHLLSRFCSLQCRRIAPFHSLPTVVFPLLPHLSVATLHLICQLVSSLTHFTPLFLMRFFSFLNLLLRFHFNFDISCP